MKRKTLFLLVGFLSGRKNKRTTAEQVKMQMKNRLPAIAVGVDNRAIAGFGKIFFAGDFRRNQMHIAERFQMFVSRFIERCDMLARNNENVLRGLRANIVKRHADIIFIN